MRIQRPEFYYPGPDSLCDMWQITPTPFLSVFSWSSLSPNLLLEAHPSPKGEVSMPFLIPFLVLEQRQTLPAVSWNMEDKELPSGEGGKGKQGRRMQMRRARPVSQLKVLIPNQLHPDLKLA